jgi:hypothetical protein
MGIDVFRHVSCPEEKLIENLEVGDNTGNNFDAIYLGFFYERISTWFDVSKPV